MTPAAPFDRNFTRLICALFLALTACAGGADGKNALVRLTSEMPGTNCPSGGASVQAGLDKNANGALDDDEVNASQTTYLCNGVNGSVGATGDAGVAGANGTNGTNGSNGANGVVVDGGDGLNALTLVTNEPRGENCEFGGARIDIGADVDRNGVLAASEITGTRYICQDTTVDAMHFGDIIIRNAGDLAQLHGVQLLIGSLIFEDVFGTGFTATDLVKVSGEIRCTVGDGQTGGGGRGLVGLLSLNFPKLTQVGSLYISYQEDLSSISAPELLTANDIGIESNPKLTNLSLPKLRVVTDEMWVYGNDLLETLSLPELTSLGNYLDVSSHLVLTTLELPKLTVAYEGLYFSNNEALDTCALYRLVKRVRFAERGGISNNKPGVCSAADECRALTLAGYTDAVYQCIGRKTYSDQRTVCAALGTGGELYWAQSAEEWSALQAAAQRGEVVHGAYLGYSDVAEEGTWVALGGFTAFDPVAGESFWAAGEPNNQGDEDFAQIYESGLVNDIPDGASTAVCRVPAP